VAVDSFKDFAVAGLGLVLWVVLVVWLLPKLGVPT
jgi:hypothetical protein